MGAALDKLMGTNTLRPQGQSYGGDLSQGYLERDQQAQLVGNGMVQGGTDAANRAAYGMMVDTGQLNQSLQGQAQGAQNAYGAYGADAAQASQAANVQALGYGSDAQRQLGNYGQMRGAANTAAGNIAQAGESGARQLEGYARGAAGEYQSGADAAFRAATDATQRNALGLAARGGAADMREALASSTMANQQAALQQQATRAQEANQLNAMRNEAAAQAAGLRQQGYGAQAGVQTQLGGMDQQAAQLQAQRQHAAQGLGASYFGQQGQAIDSGNAYQLQNAGLQGQLVGANTQAQLGAAGATIGAGQGMTNAYLGAETQQNSAQLGADMATEQQRQAYEKGQTPGAKAHAVLGMSLDPGGLVFK